MSCMYVSCSGSSQETKPFEGYRLVLPCISVGNVGQLTSDLLINSLLLKRVGYLHHPALLPLVGNDAFDHTSTLHTTAEVYSGSQLKIAVVQMRAPIAKGFKQSFCSDLLSWVRGCGASEVILLTSSHAHERRDTQLSGPPFRFLLSPECSDLFSHFTEQLKWTALEPRNPGMLDSADVCSPGCLPEQQLFLPGSGLAKRLYSMSSNSGVRLVVLVAFCSQGDNIPDAIELADHLDVWLLLLRSLETKEKKTWLCPQSWSLMYGGPSPETLF